MSTTPEPADSEYTAGLIAEALITEASRSSEHRRLYLTGHLGLRPSALFEALRRYLRPEAAIEVKTLSGPICLEAAPLGHQTPAEAILVPYLVGPPGLNSGTAGFAAYLRDEVPDGDIPRVLLILDEQPVETVRTAAENAGLLDGLQWSQMINAAIAGAPAATAPLLEAVRSDLNARPDRVRRDYTTVGTLRRLAAYSTPSEVGAGLYRLGCYVSDPDAISNPRQRLKASQGWRDKLDTWSAPDQNLEARLIGEYEDQDDARLAHVLEARTPFGLDFSQFVLADLPAARRAAVRTLKLASPIRARGAACASQPGRAVLWAPDGATFSIMLMRPAATAATATMIWADGSAPTRIPIAAGDREIAFDLHGEGWRFARLELSNGERAELAIFFDPGEWAPFEGHIDLDFTTAAFRCPGDPDLWAMDPTGRLVGQPGLQVPNTDYEDGEPRRYLAVLGSQSRPIDLVVGATEDDEGEEPSPEPPNRPEPTDPGDYPTPPSDPEDDGDSTGQDTRPLPPTAPTVTPRVPSVAHAKLIESRQGQVLGGSSFSIKKADGRGRIKLAGTYDLVDQQIGSGLDGLAFEREILNKPRVTAFEIARSAAGITLDRHPYLDRLDLHDLPEQLRTDFFDARTNLFAALEPPGSVHALGTGTGLAEARTYVAAYEALLDAMLGNGRFRAEFERLVLCDAVSDPTTGEVYIAPTNPVSISYLLALTDTIEQWLPDAAEVLDADVSTLNIRHLLPTFALQGAHWYETADDVPLLWRRYRMPSQASPGEHRPAYIAKRIEHFLDVHPEYRDQRQVLALAFHEPGDGTTVLDALRRFVRPAATSADPPALPHLDVTIISARRTQTALQSIVSGAATGSAANAPLDRLLRDRVSVRIASPDDDVPKFAHISFVFQSSLDREPAEVNLSGRASTLYADGLAAAPGRHTEPGRNETAFSWGTFTGTVSRPGLPALVRKTLELVGGMPRDNFVSSHTRMLTTRIGSAFLGNLYDSSAWVVHLDKLLGLEAFAPDARGRQARYLIDYEDRADPGQPGLDAITATSRVAPYRLALRQALVGMGQPTENGLDRLLKLFNGVSGRWALDLIGANPNDLHERIGLAAAIASLHDLDGPLETGDHVGIVIPLEELLDALPAAARQNSGTFCDDLLYLQVPFGQETPRLRGRLLEVKYRGSTDAGTPAYARQQLQHAHDWLLRTFGPDNEPRRLFRARDLAELIRGSATRANAFGLLNVNDRSAFEAAIDAIGHGDYTLTLDYHAGSQKLHGDFVSVEAGSTITAHRQTLPGGGLPFGHLRLGRPFLEALAAGQALPRPATLPLITYPEPGSAQEESPSPPPADGSPGPGPEAEPYATDPGPSPTATTAPPEDIPVIAGRLDAAFMKYGLSVEPFAPDLAQAGPSVIRFRTRTLGKLSISEVERRARDLGREIAAAGQVQIADEPGFVTVDVPRSERLTITLADVLPVLGAAASKPGALNFVAGVAPSGDVRVADLSRLPHLLVAGATGSGKSVFLRGLLIELLRDRTPDQLHLMIVDPKRLDFTPFARVPHLRSGAIISDPDEALELLRSTLEHEIAVRQPILESAGVSSAAEYYEAGGRLEDLPQLVILVDEFGELVLAGHDRKAFSELIQRYAQLTRAYGIYLVLATQRPSVDVVTGSIKTNLSARIAFSLPSSRDSMTILDRGGAEDLLGDGDLLFYCNGRIERLQAPFATITDVRQALTKS